MGELDHHCICNACPLSDANLSSIELLRTNLSINTKLYLTKCIWKYHLQTVSVLFRTQYIICNSLHFWIDDRRIMVPLSFHLRQKSLSWGNKSVRHKKARPIPCLYKMSFVDHSIEYKWLDWENTFCNSQGQCSKPVGYGSINHTDLMRIPIITTTTYHGYAMRKILPLCIKTVTGKSKGFLCLFGHNSRIHCFWLKNQNLFSQNITFRVINYLNLVEKIIRNWNVDGVSVPIISKDIR